MTQLYRAIALAGLALGPAFGEELPSPELASPDARVLPAQEAQVQEDEYEHLYAAPTRWDQIGRIAAPVMINGQGPFRLILDTGASESVITRRVADVLGIEIREDSRVLLNGVTGSMAVPAVRLSSMTTGDLVQEDVRVAVLGSVMGGADGILGVQGFDGMRITVEFRNDRITIERSRGQRARRSEGTIPATLRFGRLLVVDGRVGRIPVKAVIDTGAEMTLGNLALLEEMMSRRRGNTANEAIVTGLDLTTQRGMYLRAPKIRLGDADIENLYVIFGDIHVFKMWDLVEEPAILVGMDILGSLERLVIDYRREEIHFRNAFRLP